MEWLLRHLYGWHGFLYIDQGFASHFGWGIAVTLLGAYFFGRRGMWVCGLLWIGYAFFHEFIEEDYEPTAWSDVVSRCLGVVPLLVWDAIRACCSRK